MNDATRRPVSMVAVSSGIITVHSDPGYGRPGPTSFYALCSDGTMWAYVVGGSRVGKPVWEQMDSIPGTPAAAG